MSARSNVKDWTYINMDKINPAIDIQEYTPSTQSLSSLLNWVHIIVTH